MTAGVGLAAFAIVTAAVALLLFIQEVHNRALNARVSKVVLGVPTRRAPSLDSVGWLSQLGRRYRRFYSAEDLDQLRAMVQASGFNHHRTLSLWIGVKVVSGIAAPLLALLIAELMGRSPVDALIFTMLGVALGIMGPRLALTMLKKRFNKAVQRGTPDAIDLLVVCSEAGMGLESAVHRVAEEMNRSNPAIASVLFNLLDDLRILPNRREAFDRMAASSEGLRRFATMISQSLQYGTPLSRALRAIAEELRRDALIRLEERAHKLGAKLILPMVLFLLPAMFVILGGSSFLHLMRAFQQP